MTNDLTDEQEEWADETEELLWDVIDAADLVIYKIRMLKRGEITLDEFEEWVENNDEKLEALEL